MDSQEIDISTATVADGEVIVSLLIEQLREHAASARSLGSRSRASGRRRKPELLTDLCFA